MALWLTIAGLIAAAALYQTAAARRDARRFPAPGRLIDIGGRALHARIEGDGSPPVVFEAGISASSINWAAVESRVAAFTTTCSYDRAGLGWSDAAPGPRTARGMAGELNALLEKLPLEGPFVLVGHSFGGLLVRLFAELWPEKVAGLVLIDPVLACEWANPSRRQRIRLRYAAHLSRRGAMLARLGVVRLATAPLLRGSARMSKMVGRASALGASDIMDRIVGEIRKMGPEVWP